MGDEEGADKCFNEVDVDFELERNESAEITFIVSGDRYQTETEQEKIEIKEEEMSKRKCDVCGEERDMGWPGAKICSNCGIFLCSKHGSGRSECPHCHKHALR